MAQFYGGVEGNRGEATRLGTKSSGLTTFASGWGGQVTVSMWHDDREDRDRFYIRVGPHPSGGSGPTITVAQGYLDDAGRADLERELNALEATTFR